MIQIYNNKHLTWDGTTSINHYELFADTVTDLPSDPYCFSSPDKGNYKMAQGSIAWVIDVSEIYMLDSDGTWVLESISGGGGGGGGTTNYNALTNKPSINSVELSGNKTLSDLGIQSAIDSSHKISADLVSTSGTTNQFNMQADWTQTTNTAGDYIKNKPNLGTAALAATTDFATAAQGTKADSAIQSVKIGGSALTPDSNKAVNITSIPSSVTATTQSQKDNSTKIATTAYVDKAISDLPEPMVWTGTITITADVSDTTKCSIVVSEPASAANIKQGFTYKISSIADTPAYTGTLKVGDTMIAAKDAPAVTSTWVADTDWNIVPSGDEPSGTVMSVTASNGLKTASGTAITATGDIQANLASPTALSGNTIYNVGLNNSGNLAVKVPTVSKTAVGLTPQLPNESTTTKFLRQDGSWEVPTYTTVTESSNNGKITVNGSDVSIHGLGTAAYTASTAYATSTQGGKADTAIQSVKRNGTALTPDANKAVDVACIESLGSTPTANDIATWNTSTGLKDSGVSIETNTTFSESSDTKIPTSKSIATNVASKAVLTGYSVDTSRSNITSSSTIRDAVEQLEYREELNTTNILSNTADDYLNWTKAKNKLNYDINTAKALNTSSIYTWSGNTCTVNGITYTFNSDKTITATGSLADSTSNAILSLASYTGATGDILSAQQTGNEYIYLRGGSTSTASTLYAPWSNGDVGVERTVAVVITPAETATINKTFYPMVCTTADWQKSQGYFPYALSNVDLTTLSKQNQTNISSITPAIIGNTQEATSITITGLNSSSNTNCLLMCTNRRGGSGIDELYMICRYATEIRLTKLAGASTPTISLSNDVVTVSGLPTYLSITCLSAQALTLAVVS